MARSVCSQNRKWEYGRTGEEAFKSTRTRVYSRSVSSSFYEPIEAQMQKKKKIKQPIKKEPQETD